MHRPLLSALVAAILLASAAVTPSVLAAQSQDVIVVLGVAHAPTRESSGLVGSVLAANSATRFVQPTHVYRNALNGFAARLTAHQQQVLARNPNVAAIVADEQIEVADDPFDSPENSPTEPSEPPSDSPAPSPMATPRATPLPTPGPDFQIVPTGIERVGRPELDGARLNGREADADIDIAVVDTGVNEHPDLNVVGGQDCTGTRSGDWHDRHGHGTHVAGTAAARDNDFGVVGVAPGARIWSVRVLNRYGIGKASWLLCGIDWITAQRTDDDRPLIEVANMSLRFHAVRKIGDDGACGTTNRDPVHQAICASILGGTKYVVAAGNDHKNASRYRPGAYREVITVSALADFDGLPGGEGAPSETCPSGVARDRDDTLARFSNFGAAIDIMAPGKCIWSTAKDGGYREMSGTSMATPHVTGAVALYLLANPDMTEAEVRAALIRCATDDWLVGSDRDDEHEPLLNISRLC